MSCIDVDLRSQPEIVAGAVTIRLEAGASADEIASVVCALATCPNGKDFYLLISLDEE